MKDIQITLKKQDKVVENKAVSKNKVEKNQTFYYIRRITPKRVTNLRCPTPRHSAKATQLLA